MIFLTKEEVAELTDRQHYQAQCEVLSKMGIPYKCNLNRRPIVIKDLAIRILSKGASSHYETNNNGRRWQSARVKN